MAGAKLCMTIFRPIVGYSHTIFPLQYYKYPYLKWNKLVASLNHRNQINSPSLKRVPFSCAVLNNSYKPLRKFLLVKNWCYINAAQLRFAFVFTQRKYYIDIKGKVNIVAGYWLKPDQKFYNNKKMYQT